MIIAGTSIEIPDNLIVDGELNLEHTCNISLPNQLTICNNFHLGYSEICELPKGLTVEGNLYLMNTNLTALPEDLTVCGLLNITFTMITEIPDSIIVGDFIFGPRNKYLASESTQLRLIKKSERNIRIFAEPTCVAKRLHEMLWMI